MVSRSDPILSINWRSCAPDVQRSSHDGGRSRFGRSVLIVFAAIERQVRTEGSAARSYIAAFQEDTIVPADAPLCRRICNAWHDDWYDHSLLRAK